MKTAEQILIKISEINNSELGRPRTEESYKKHLTSILEWVIER